MSHVCGTHCERHLLVAQLPTALCTCRVGAFAWWSLPGRDKKKNKKKGCRCFFGVEAQKERQEMKSENKLTEGKKENKQLESMRHFDHVQTRPVEAVAKKASKCCAQKDLKMTQHKVFHFFLCWSFFLFRLALQSRPTNHHFFGMLTELLHKCGMLRGPRCSCRSCLTGRKTASERDTTGRQTLRDGGSPQRGRGERTRQDEGLKKQRFANFVTDAWLPCLPTDLFFHIVNQYYMIDVCLHTLHVSTCGRTETTKRRPKSNLKKILARSGFRESHVKLVQQKRSGSDRTVEECGVVARCIWLCLKILARLLAHLRNGLKSFESKVFFLATVRVPFPRWVTRGALSGGGDDARGICARRTDTVQI